MSRHLMLIPSPACQAHCAYCFGPNEGPVMSAQVLDAALDWIASTTADDETLELTFHGGEPLLAGIDWYRRALPLLRERRPNSRLAVQSNLWLLDDAFCALFNEHGVSLGTSLDGPQPINDRQRGKGYFARTMAGIERARRNGLDVGVICTFTRRSAPHYRRVCEFFAAQQLSFSVHAAVAVLRAQPANGFALSPQAHAELMEHLFEYYLDHLTELRISTFDAMARGISSGSGGICTFGNCLGHYLTVGPEGGLYTCNRFVGHPEWQVGTVRQQPTLDELAQAPAWRRLSAREAQVAEECRDCVHYAYCRGGCAYNATSASAPRARDPHCPAYQRLFARITDRAMEEVFSEQNLEAVVRQGASAHGLLRKGKLLQIMRGGPHPRAVARRARELVAAVALASSRAPRDAVRKLDRAGLVTRREVALGSLTALRERLDAQPQGGPLNAYLHVTEGCNLRCTHCYANAGPGRARAMDVPDAARLVRQIAAAGFRKAVITGGEPLVHPQREALLDALAALRGTLAPLQIVLRTNLAYPLSPDLAERMARCADQTVVSVDGDPTSHDARRGAGTYERTVENLRLLSKALRERQGRAENPSRLGITAVLPVEQIDGPEGQAVRDLGAELGARVRFKAVLPLGRGAALDLHPAFYSSLDDGPEAVAYGARPALTCGLGMNVYLGADGACAPCYALTGARHSLGNALDEGLAAVLARNDAYRGVTVDSNRRCRRCALRYLCGGFCRAWGSGGDPDAPPVDCRALHERARGLLLNALEALEVPEARWRAAGLPLPDAPPN